jgi:hypothetical protein
MQNATIPGTTTPNSYSPSVPISLYREVAAELQTAKAMLESLKTHNQQLVQQNQQLRREVETVVYAAGQLQQAINSAQAVTQIPIPQMPLVKANFSAQAPYPTSTPLHLSGETPEISNIPSPLELPFPFPEVEPTNSHNSERLYTEEPERPYRLRSQSKKTPELSGIWLTVAIFLIVVAAFSAGYWVVRPVLMKK